MTKKGSISLDWIISSLIYIGVIIFIFFYLWNVHKSTLSGESKQITECKVRHSYYTPRCEGIYLISETPYYGNLAPYNISQHKFNVPYILYLVKLNKSQKYYLYSQPHEKEKSDIAVSSDWINNSYININLSDLGIMYGGKEIANMKGNAYTSSINDGLGVVNTSDYLIIVPPLAPQIIALSDWANISFKENFHYVVIEGHIIYVNGTGKLFGSRGPNICIRTLPEVCIDGDPFIDVEIYNYSLPYMLVKVPTPYLSMVFGSFEGCENSEEMRRTGYSVEYKRC